MANNYNIVLPKLYEWQKDVISQICNKPGSGRVVVVKSRRQCGKTFTCCATLLHYACTYANTTSAIIEPTNAQARKVFKTIVKAVDGTGILKSKNETFLTVELVNGSTIMFKSAQIKEGLRGYTITGVLILDEAAFLAPDILELVLPWIQVHKAPMLMVSTPKIRDGVFYSYWKEGVEGTPEIISIDWSEYDTSALLDENTVELYRKTLTANQFKSEILGEWLDDEGLVFQYVRENTIPNVPKYGARCFVGIDFGSGNKGDFTSFSVLDENAQMIHLDYFNDLSTLQQIERLVKDILIFGNSIVSINAENNSIGSPLIDLIVKELNDRGERVLVSKINRWITTNKSKGELVNEMQVGLEQGTIKLFDDKVLVNQFCSYEAEYNPKTQVITYNGAYGTHDDIVMSTMLAYDAYLKGSNQGVYCLSFPTR